MVNLILMEINFSDALHMHRLIHKSRSTALYIHTRSITELKIRNMQRPRCLPGAFYPSLASAKGHYFFPDFCHHGGAAFKHQNTELGKGSKEEKERRWHRIRWFLSPFLSWDSMINGFCYNSPPHSFGRALWAFLPKYDFSFFISIPFSIISFHSLF